jgi:hypothetical protein
MAVDTDVGFLHTIIDTRGQKHRVHILGQLNNGTFRIDRILKRNGKQLENVTPETLKHTYGIDLELLQRDQTMVAAAYKVVEV